MSPYSQLPKHTARAFPFAGAFVSAGAAAGFFAAAILPFAAAFAFSLVTFASTLALGAMALDDRLYKLWQLLDAALTQCEQYRISRVRFKLEVRHGAGPTPTNDELA